MSRVTKLKNDPKPDENAVLLKYLFPFYFAHPCVLGNCVFWIAEYGDKCFVMIADLILNYVKSLQVQTHLSFSAVGMPVSFIQQVFPNLKSGQALCRKGGVDKI